jgi:DNA-binding PadR family transcriptional regulator
MTPQVFQVLLSLSDAPRHGYAMIQDIDERTGGEIRLTASTLYDALARLVDAGLITEVEAPEGDADRDSRRRYYALTRPGRDAAAKEARRLERTLAMAREKKIIG